MTQQTKILIVDDDPIIRHLLHKILQEEYAVSTANCGLDAIKIADNNSFALGLLDIHLGDMNGIELLKILQTKMPDTIFIMLTGQASLETAVAALRQGAHDYIQKPFQAQALQNSLQEGLQKRQEMLHNRVVLEQIQAVRNALSQIDTTEPTAASATIVTPNNAQQQTQQRFFQHGSLRIDITRHRVTVADQNIQLSPIEYKLLVYLMEAAPRVVSPQELVTAIQGHDSESWEASEMIRPHIYRIRQKIRLVAPQEKVIRTVRGTGYALGDE